MYRPILVALVALAMATEEDCKKGRPDGGSDGGLDGGSPPADSGSPPADGGGVDAGGALAGYEIVSAQTAVTSDSLKQVSVTCPSGKRALGAGWAVLDSTSAILDGKATYFAPSWDGSGWLANAENLSSFAAAWKLKVQVQCAPAPARYQVVSAETAVTGLRTKQLQVSCPGGTRGLGAGWAALDATSAILRGEASYFAPSWDGTSWLVNAESSAAAWKLKVQVLCADLAGYEVVVASVTAVGSAEAQQISSCPDGKVVAGAGWAVLDGTAAILDGDARYFFPSWDGAGWMTNATYQGASGPVSSWQLRNWLLCVAR